MLLSPANFKSMAQKIALWPNGILGIDLETSGLQVRAGAQAFILGFAWREYGMPIKHSVLTTPETYEAIRLLVSNPNVRYLAHNAKFELSFLRHQFQAEVAGSVWDTEVFARVQFNTHLRYGLQHCAERIGLSKYPPMLEWLKANKRAGLLHDSAPLELCIPYVEQDAWLEIPVYENQYETFKQWELNSDPSNPRIGKIIHLELATTKNLFEIEDAGMDINIEYCKEALNYERTKADHAATEFKRITGVDFVDSRKTLQGVFERRGVAYGRTDKGNPSFTAEALAPFSSDEVVKSVLDYRGATKRASAYWDNFIGLEAAGRIYPNIRQCGAKSFRMSVANPSCQNWSRDDDDPKYPIRRAFTCGPDEVIVSLDYSQMELRLMADEAGDTKMAEAFKNGTDFHQEVAVAAGVPRTLAKNGRFAKLYGAGVARVAETLGVAYEVAQRICAALDHASPSISAYCRGLIHYAQKAPFGFNWLGRRYFFDRGLEYKYPNYRIQGGCAEILRIATNDIIKLLAGKQSKIIILIHDEVVLRMPKSEMHLIPQIKELMIAAYQGRILSMDVTVHVGPNLYDLELYNVPAR